MSHNQGPIELKEADVSSPEPGLRRQVLSSSGTMMLVRHTMEAGWQGACHSHPHEQLVYVIRGRLSFVRGNEKFDIAAGDSLIVPSGVEHQAAAYEASEVLDVFSPSREDYLGVSK